MLWNLVIDLINFVIRSLGRLLQLILSLLPDSPFSVLNNSAVAEYLGYIAWIIPVSQMVVILEVWLAAIAIYYVQSILLRWVKAIT